MTFFTTMHNCPLYDPTISNIFGEFLKTLYLALYLVILKVCLKHTCNIEWISLYYGKWVCNDASSGLIKLTYVKWTWTLLPSFLVDSHNRHKSLSRKISCHKCNASLFHMHFPGVLFSSLFWFHPEIKTRRKTALLFHETVYRLFFFFTE